ncbi:MAG: enoyl-CoA hydratase/isomerase family protein [Chloroflexi bacterium]|nr:enoyl-CoA hydratase/isomerase family protein [Chloroflexota bacterium]MDK1044727.1 enoyl-CoA hydratase-related protein [Anaerolineales bacterium]MCI0773040.1 enoyl-CoA hydratase/isomerase family protein [Chloroflexota bacterium]MCI0805900.1 enoyl-CoA hydratase/isomerase family protein [Chloroflexota bacterium]MCI0827354.1 enoyl-CoA hydratase/isomerase family protein [Chloroflexota bacterium]
MGQFQFINLDQSGGVLTAALNRPKANAFNETMIEEWLSVLKIADRDESVRCLVLTGTGRIFSAGQDVAAISRGELSLREHLHRTYNRVILKMHALEKPIVGAINGPAVGAGLGLARSVEMAFTNRAVTAEEALDWGLVNQVVPDDRLEEAVAELATRLAGGPTRAYGLSKRAINRATMALLKETLEYEAELQEIAGRTEDHAEGVAAFHEKRDPRFKGK